jgi:hypothetical protein
MVIPMSAGYIDPNATPTGTTWGMAMTRAPGRGPFEPDLCRSPLSSPNWAQLAIDIRIAARNKVPVLISAPPDFAASVARAIAAFADEWRPIEVVVCDCAGGADLGAAVANAQSVRGLHPGEVILLLRGGAHARRSRSSGSGRPRRGVARRTESNPDYLDVLCIAS